MAHATKNDRLAEDRRFVENTPAWPLWPTLPLRNRDGRAGFLVDGQPLAGHDDPGHESLRTVYLADLIWYFQDADLPARQAVEKKTYSAVEAMLADGWYVD